MIFISILSYNKSILEKYDHFLILTKEAEMKENSVLATIYENICRDTGKQNESAKLIAVVRLLTLSMLLHSLVCCVLVSITRHTGALAFSLFSPVLASCRHTVPAPDHPVHAAAISNTVSASSLGNR